MTTTVLQKGEIINFKDGESWIITKDENSRNEVMAKPYNELAKKQNVSLEISFTRKFIEENV